MVAEPEQAANQNAIMELDNPNPPPAEPDNSGTSLLANESQDLSMNEKPEPAMPPSEIPDPSDIMQTNASSGAFDNSGQFDFSTATRHPGSVNLPEPISEPAIGNEIQ